MAERNRGAGEQAVGCALRRGARRVAGELSATPAALGLGFAGAWCACPELLVGCSTA